VVAAVPALERAHRILDAMAQEPRRAFSAAELAKVVGIHRATAHSIMACLAGLGFVHRDPATTAYRLGPELVRLGGMAAEQYDGIDAARRELHDMAVQLGVGGVACVVVGDEMVIPERVGVGHPEYGVPTALHARVPLVPPIGAIFVAWSPPDEIEAWVDRSPESATAEDRESYRRSVAAIRARGYSIGSEVEFELQLEELLAGFDGPDADPADRLALALRLADLVRDERAGEGNGDGDGDGKAIDHLIGPVFGADGRVVMTLTIFGGPGQITESTLATYAEPLVAASDRVTQSIGGRRLRVARP
jgi:DNA-binding IclR family transcriptional regulator